MTKHRRFSILGFVKSIPTWIMRAIILGGCGAISLFLLASGYESLYNRSLPLVHTLDNTSLQPLERTYNLQKAFTFSKDPTDESIFGKFGAPTSLKLPGRTKKLDIVPAIHPTNSEWLARANTLHILNPEGARGGNMGVAVLYCRSGFRTLEPSNLPTEGSNLFIDTDHSWRYVYKVISATTAPTAQSYVPSDNGANAKLIIICSDARQHSSVIIDANLLTVQGVES